MTKEYIINYLHKKRELFAGRYHLKNVVLFGSYATGKATSESDVDLAYELEEGYNIGFDDFLSLNNELEEDLHVKVDLVNLNKINPLVKLHGEKDFIYV